MNTIFTKGALALTSTLFATLAVAPAHAIIFPGDEASANAALDAAGVSIGDQFRAPWSATNLP